MRALLRDAQDQTRIALEVEEVVYDPPMQIRLLKSLS